MFLPDSEKSSLTDYLDMVLEEQVVVVEVEEALHLLPIGEAVELDGLGLDKMVMELQHTHFLKLIILEKEDTLRVLDFMEVITIIHGVIPLDIHQPMEALVEVVVVMELLVVVLEEDILEEE